MMDISVVDEIMEKLETTGIDGVWARFARPPHVVMYRAFKGYRLVLWRGSVKVVVELNDEFKIESAHVEY